MKTLLYITFTASISFLSVSCKDRKSTEETRKEYEDAKEQANASLQQMLKELEAEEGKRKFDEEHLKLQQEKSDKIGTIKDLDEHSEHVEKLLKSAKDYQESQTGHIAKEAKVGTLALSKLAEETKPQADKIKELLTAQDHSDIKTTEDIDSKITIVNDYLVINNQLKTFHAKGLRSHIVDLLKQEGFSDDQRIDYLLRFDAYYDLQKPLYLEMRELDKKMCKIVIQRLNILKENLGNWKFNVSRKAPTFDTALSPDVIKTFNDAGIEFNLLAQEQINVQKQLVKFSQQ